jgi:hypothetical protein
MTQPFHFPDGRLANNAKDLLELCQQYPDDATGFLVRQDLEKWLAYIGSHDVAECAANARQIDVSDRQKLADFLNECHSLTSPQPVPPVIPEAAIENKIETIVEETLPEPASVAPLPEPPQAPTIPVLPVIPVAPVTQTTAAEKPADPPNNSPVKTPVNSNAANSNKPSFFQVVAKIIVQVLYRDKA